MLNDITIVIFFTGCQKIGMHGLRTGITGAIMCGFGMVFLNKS